MTDFSDLLRLAKELDSAPEETIPFLEKSIEVSARNLKDDWRSRAKRNTGYPRSYPNAITYDMHSYTGFGGANVYAEVGPVLHSTPGAGAGFLEESPGDVKAPPMHAARDALEEVKGDFERGIEIALADGVKKALGI